jgi:hypothetical protein
MRTASRRGSAVFAAVILGAVSLVPPLAAQTAASDSAAIHQRAGQFSAAYVRGDAGAMTELYTSDAVLFPEQSAPITGHDAISSLALREPRKPGD